MDFSCLLVSVTDDDSEELLLDDVFPVFLLAALLADDSPRREWDEKPEELVFEDDFRDEVSDPLPLPS